MSKKAIIILLSVICLLGALTVGVFYYVSSTAPKPPSPKALPPKPVATKVNLNNPPIANQKQAPIQATPSQVAPVTTPKQ